MRATDKQDLSTGSSMLGRVTINVAVPGDLAPDGLLNVTGAQVISTPGVNVVVRLPTTTASVRCASPSWRTTRTATCAPTGRSSAGFGTINANLATPNATSTNWTLPATLPTGGDYSVTAYTVDTVNQLDASPATARYQYYPGDLPPTLLPNLASPTDGTDFTESRIFVSGRAEDDIAIAEVEVAIVNSAGLYMSTNGTFSSSERWVSAFLNSRGSLGSNYSYTTPIIPDGDYQVRVRRIDNHDLSPEPRTVAVTVTAPAGNEAPVAVASVSCTRNVCAFDGREAPTRTRRR